MYICTFEYFVHWSFIYLLRYVFVFDNLRCTVIIDYKGECRFAVGEMEVFSSISPHLVKKYQSYVENSSFIVLDGNLPLDTIRYVLDLATCSKIPGR